MLKAIVSIHPLAWTCRAIVPIKWQIWLFMLYLEGESFFYISVYTYILYIIYIYIEIEILEYFCPAGVERKVITVVMRFCEMLRSRNKRVEWELVIIWSITWRSLLSGECQDSQLNKLRTSHTPPEKVVWKLEGGTDWVCFYGVILMIFGFARRVCDQGDRGVARLYSWDCLNFA